MPDIMMRLGKDILVAEGAMGTMLQRAGAPKGTCLDQLNEIDDEMVENVHRLYHLAGANVAITNTFGATRARLAEFDVEMRADEINRAGVRIARRVKPEHILGDIGPCTLMLPPTGDSTFEENYRQYYDQAKSLAAEDPDGIIIETMMDIADARAAVIAARDATDLPVFACCTFNAQGVMPVSGTDPATAALILEASGADAVGINCSLGPAEVYPMMQKMARVTSLPLIVMPNAGVPQTDARGKVTYPVGPDEFARWAVRFAQLGCAIIGSCCGSTPAHTGAIAGMLAGARVVPREVNKPAGMRLVYPRGVAVLGASDGPALIAHVGDAGDVTGATGVSADEAEDLVDEVEDASDLGAVACLATLAGRGPAGADAVEDAVSADDPEQPQATPSAVVSQLMPYAQLPVGFAALDTKRLESVLASYPGRPLVDAGEWEAESGRYDELIGLARRYGAALVVRASAAGPEYHYDDVAALWDDVRARAGAAGLTERDIILDVSSPRIGDEALQTMLALLRYVQGTECLSLLDTATWRRSPRGTADGLERLGQALDAGIDLVGVDIRSEHAQQVADLVAHRRPSETSE